MPDRETDIAVAEITRNVGEATHLIDGDLADRQHDADPVQPGLLLRMHANMGGAIERRTRLQRFGGTRVELAPELFLDEREKLFNSQLSNTYFSRALVRLVRSPWSI